MTRPFKLMPSGPRDPRAPKFIRWDALNEDWAQKNHDQDLATLDRRGGLSACEALAIIERRAWHRMDWELALAKILPFAYEADGGDPGRCCPDCGLMFCKCSVPIKEGQQS